MFLFLLFLLFSFFAGLALRKTAYGTRLLLFLAVAVLMSMLYFVLERLI